MPDRVEMVEISICICTFRRPTHLTRLLNSLRSLAAETPSHEIIIVDNDAGGSAKRVVNKFAQDGFAVRYLIEPVQNISRARNRSVAEARGKYVAFIDDDEEAASRWLVELYRELNRHGTEGAFGQVVPQFDLSAPQWIRDGGFFNRETFATGTLLDYRQTRTGNALINREALVSMPGPFDEAFGLTGGEDTDLFARMTDRGFRFIAVESALVYEDLPLARTTPRWLLYRRFRIGINSTRRQRRHFSRAQLLSHILRSLRKFITLGLRGLLLFPFYRTRGFSWVLRSVESLGNIAQVIGFSYEEYRHNCPP